MQLLLMNPCLCNNPRKNKRNEIKIFSRKCDSIIKDGYQDARVEITNTQLNKIKSAAKSETGTIIRINKKHFEGKELPHKLFLTYANYMSTDIKLYKAQISEIIQSS